MGQRTAQVNSSHNTRCRAAHHGCTPACLHPTQPRHVDGGARAAVSVRRGAVDGGKVIACMHHQEVIGNTAGTKY